MVLGQGIYRFDCLLWSNTGQDGIAAELRVNNPSLTALNSLVRNEGYGDRTVAHWKFVVGDDERGSGR